MAVSKMKWAPVESSEEKPLPRHGHRAVTVDDLIVVFGGGNAGIIDDLHVFNTGENKWFIPHITGDIPTGRAAFGFANKNTRIFMFGGMLEFGMYSNDLYELETSQWKWNRLWPSSPVDGLLPCARFGHSFILAGDKFFLFGGLANECSDPKFNIPRYLNDLYQLEVFGNGKAAWSIPKTSGKPPPPRESHTAVYYVNLQGQRKMFIYGGMSGCRLGDLWTLDLDTMVWEQPIASGMQPLPRSLHTATIISNKMFIFGGWVPFYVDKNYDKNKKGWVCTNQLGCLNLDTFTWEEISIEVGKANLPKPRAGHIAVNFNNRMYIWSGRDGYKTDKCYQVCCNDMWFLEVGKPGKPRFMPSATGSITSLDLHWEGVPATDHYILQIQKYDPTDKNISSPTITIYQALSPANRARIISTNTPEYNFPELLTSTWRAEILEPDALQPDFIASSPAIDFPPESLSNPVDVPIATNSFIDYDAKIVSNFLKRGRKENNFGTMHQVKPAQSKCHGNPGVLKLLTARRRQVSLLKSESSSDSEGHTETTSDSNYIRNRNDLPSNRNRLTSERGNESEYKKNKAPDNNFLEYRNGSPSNISLSSSESSSDSEGYIETTSDTNYIRNRNYSSSNISLSLSKFSSDFKGHIETTSDTNDITKQNDSPSNRNRLTSVRANECEKKINKATGNRSVNGSPIKCDKKPDGPPDYNYHVVQDDEGTSSNINDGARRNPYKTTTCTFNKARLQGILKESSKKDAQHRCSQQGLDDLSRGDDISESGCNLNVSGRSDNSNDSNWSVKENKSNDYTPASVQDNEIMDETPSNVDSQNMPSTSESVWESEMIDELSNHSGSENTSSEIANHSAVRDETEGNNMKVDNNLDASNSSMDSNTRNGLPNSIQIKQEPLEPHSPVREKPFDMSKIKKEPLEEVKQEPVEKMKQEIKEELPLEQIDEHIPENHVEPVGGVILYDLLYEFFRNCGFEGDSYEPLITESRPEWVEVSGNIRKLDCGEIPPGVPPCPLKVKFTTNIEGVRISWEPPPSETRIIEYEVLMSVREDQDVGERMVSTDPKEDIEFNCMYRGPKNEVMILNSTLLAANIVFNPAPAVIFRIAAKNENGYGASLQIRWREGVWVINDYFKSGKWKMDILKEEVAKRNRIQNQSQTPPNKRRRLSDQDTT